MFGANVWRRVLDVDRATVSEDFDFDEESDTVVVHVRPRRAIKRRCGRCGVRGAVLGAGLATPPSRGSNGGGEPVPSSFT